MRSAKVIALLLLIAGSGLWAQHDMHQDHAMAGDLLDVLTMRQGSGTAWMPDSTPMYGIMRESGEWHLMYHGTAFPMYDKMNGPRGDAKLVMPNWAMLMAHRRTSDRDMLRLSTMISLEPLTVGGAGYPLLFQSGETWRDEPLKDHQHPHNYISELSVKHTRALSPGSTGFVYLAPVGEPALGPVAYIHRMFGLDDPLAPIGHHWQDVTHITFGVATLGYQTHKWQIEASSFNGREPGENRLAIEKPRFDSFSGRLSLNPNDNVAAQVSYGSLNSPEALHPGVDIHRSTASVTYNRPVREGVNFESSLIWSRNRITERNLDSLMVEAQWKHDGGWTPFLRYETIRKDAEELVLPPAFDPDDVFTLQQTTLGITHDLPSRGELQWGIGGAILLNNVPSALKDEYGDNPVGWIVFLRVHPKRHTMRPMMEHPSGEHGM